MINLKLLAAAAAGSTFLALSPSMAFAADEHFPPTLGTPSCHGDIVGFGASHGHPIGQVAKQRDVSVQFLQDRIWTICAV
jgi:hypothetical protein